MNKALPTAIIVGIEHFVAKKLAALLLSRDINVVGVGEYAEGLSEKKNYEYRVSLDEVEVKASYVFDFVGSEDVWNIAEQQRAKLTVVAVNKKNVGREVINKLIKRESNWRVVEAYGVYGAGMEEEGFLARAIRQSVKNENLILPHVSEVYRLLNVEDTVEVILRASFLSGTDGQIFKIWGVETSSAEVAEVLIDEAKMTKMKVIQEKLNIETESEDEVGGAREKLRWQPVVSFREGIGETLQYFFSKIDEENRRKKTITTETLSDVVVENLVEVEKGAEETRKEFVEVVVEEELPVEEESVDDVEEEVIEQEDEELVEEVVAKEEVVEEEDFDEEPIVVKKEIEEIKEPVLTEIEIPRKKRKLKIYWQAVLTSILLVFLAIPVWLGVVGFASYRTIKKGLSLIESRQYDKSEEIFREGAERIKKTDGKLDEIGLNKIGIIRNYQKILRVGEGAFSAGLTGMELLRSSESMSGALFGENEISFQGELELMRKNLNILMEETGVVQARLGGDWTFLPTRWRSVPQREAKRLDVLRKDLELGSHFLEVADELLGLDGTRREYLVLLQNESELRPNGGFIGSVGFLSFQGGKLLKFEVKDVYEIDGQLKGHVEPPTEIRDHLGEAGWFLRDANWNPNFLVSAAQIQWFLEKSVNQKVDGVIGINLAVAREILSVVGEVQVVDFNEKVNKDNLYEQAQFYAETKFFPGSIQKASFLGGVSKQLFEEIKLLPSNKKLELGRVFIKMLLSNDLQMALNDKEAARKMAEMSWDGSMYSGKCRNEDCVSDYLYVLEANVGVNKANYFLYRNIEQVIDISQRSVARVVKINYENTAKNNGWPGGDYKNYLRLYLPNNINIAQVSISDADRPESVKVYGREDLNIKQLGSKTELGFLVTVPINSKKTVEVRYSSEINITNKDKFSYIHYIQRQPGFGDTGLVTLLSMPTGWQPLQVQPTASLVGGKLLFNQKLETDIKMGVELSK